MGLAVDLFDPADGEGGVKPNQVVRVSLSNAGPVRTEVEETDLSGGTLTDVVWKHGHLRLDAVDTLYAIGPAATSPWYGRTACTGLPVANEPWTVIFPIKFTNAAWPQAVFMMGTEAAYQGISLWVGPTQAGWRHFGGNGTFNAVGTLNDGAWHVCAFVYDGANTIDFYRDGELKGTLSIATLSLTGARVQMFHVNDQPTWYARAGMLVDMVQVWGRAFDGPEIAAFNGFVDDPTDLKGWWKFGEGSGDDAADETANANDLYVLAGGNSPAWGAGEYGDNDPTYDTPGDRVSPAQDVSGVAEYGDAVVEWDSVEPAGTTVTVEVSDDGASWQACTNGGRLPPIYTLGASMAGEDLYTRVTLATTDTGVTPRVERVAVTFKAMLLEQVEVEVAGVPCTVGNGRLRAQNVTGIVGGTVVEDLSDVTFYAPTLLWYPGERADVDVDVSYDGTPVDDATFTTGEIGKVQGEEVAFAFWEALAVAFPLSRSVADPWFHVATPRQGATRDVAFLVGDVLRRTRADVLYYVARLYVNDYDGSVVVALANVDDHEGSVVVEGYNVGDHEGGCVVQGWFVDDIEGFVVAALDHLFDTEGFAVVGTQEVDDHEGGFVVRGVVRGTVVEVRVVSDATLDQYDDDGFTVG